MSNREYRHYRSRDYYRRNSEDRHSRVRPRSKIMGVCAGLANQFGWDVSGVRVVAVLGLIFFTGPTFLAYIVAGALFY
jgi:phage shock protein PspC (stress-responsive transcriptional regulator)